MLEYVNNEKGKMMVTNESNGLKEVMTKQQEEKDKAFKMKNWKIKKDKKKEKEQQEISAAAAAGQQKRKVKSNKI